ncbi:MAG: right-handed parallel beta-helix repeat-containing protein [Planctomycetota bacterium JB042]
MWSWRGVCGLREGVWAIGALLFTGSAVARTDVGGALTSHTTWSVAGSPFAVTSSIVVENGAVLTIDPGVEVRVGAGLSIRIGSTGLGAGTLVARGTPQSPVVFTSVAATPGRWSELLFSADATDATFSVGGAYRSGSILEQCVVEFGGGAGAGVRVVDSAPYLASCTVRGNQGDGLSASWTGGASALRVHDCTFRQNGGRGAGLALGAGHEIVGCAFDTNGARGLEVRTAPQSRVEACLFVKNGGGGVLVSGSGGVDVVRNVVRENGVLTDHGGVRLESCGGATVDENEIVENGGGGLRLVGSANALVKTNRIEGNLRASNGAGVLASASPGASFVENDIRSNQTGTRGGGVHLEATSNVTFERNVVAENFAFVDGGGVAADGASGSLTFSDNEVLDNGARFDGGGFWFGGRATPTSNPVQLAGNLVLENVVGGVGRVGRGGGVYVRGHAVTFVSNLLASNSADQGGGLFVDTPAAANLAGTPTAFDTIVCNEATQGSAVFDGLPYGASGSGDVPAHDVCWGTTTASEIGARIWDHADDPALGAVGVSNPVPCDPFHDFGHGVAGVNGVPVLAGSGPLVPSTAVTISLANAAPSSPALLVADLAAAHLPLEGDVLVPGLAVVVNLTTSPSGEVAMPLTWPAGLPPGTKLFLQALVADPAAANGALAFSNALLAVQP